MIKSLNTTIKIEPNETDRNFKVTFTREDQADAEDIQKNMVQIQEQIKEQEYFLENARAEIDKKIKADGDYIEKLKNEQKKFLDTIDEALESRKAQAVKDIEANKKLLEDFKAVESKVKLWSKLDDFEEKRKNGESIQQNSTDNQTQPN